LGGGALGEYWEGGALGGVVALGGRSIGRGSIGVVALGGWSIRGGSIGEHGGGSIGREEHWEGCSIRGSMGW